QTCVVPRPPSRGSPLRGAPDGGPTQTHDCAQPEPRQLRDRGNAPGVAGGALNERKAVTPTNRLGGPGAWPRGLLRALRACSSGSAQRVQPAAPVAQGPIFLGSPGYGLQAQKWIPRIKYAIAAASTDISSSAGLAPSLGTVSGNA